MENAGSAIVDFGRFVTGFLVVMGIGMLDLWFEWVVCEGGVETWLGQWGTNKRVRVLGSRVMGAG